MADYSLWLKTEVTVKDPNVSSSDNSSKLYSFAFRSDDTSVGAVDFVMPPKYYYPIKDTSGRTIVRSISYDNYSDFEPDLALAQFVSIDTLKGSTAIMSYLKGIVKTDEEYKALSETEQARYAPCLNLSSTSTSSIPDFPNVLWCNVDDCGYSNTGNATGVIISDNGTNVLDSVNTMAVSLSYTYYAHYPSLTGSQNRPSTGVVGTATHNNNTYYYKSVDNGDSQITFSYGSIIFTKSSGSSDVTVNVTLNTDPRVSSTTKQYSFTCSSRIFRGISGGTFIPQYSALTGTGKTCEKYYDGTVVFSTKTTPDANPLDDNIIVGVDPIIQGFGIDTDETLYSIYDGKVTVSGVEKEQFTIRVYSTSQPYLFWDDQNENGIGWVMSGVLDSPVDPVTNARYWQYTVTTTLGSVDSDYEKAHYCSVGISENANSRNDSLYIVPISGTDGSIYSGIYDGSNHNPVSSWPSYVYPVAEISVAIAYDSVPIDYEGVGGVVSSIKDAGSYSKLIVRNGYVTTGGSFSSFRVVVYSDEDAVINPRPVTISAPRLS